MGALDEAKVKRVIEVDKKVIEASRRKGIKIVYLRMGYRPDLSNAGGPESPNYWKELGLVAMRDQMSSDSLPQPAFVAGHSLGEYTALAAAGVVDFATTVHLTRERGRLMYQAGL